MNINKFLRNGFTACLCGLTLLLAYPAFAAATGPAALSGNSLQITKQTSMSQIRALSDNATVRTSNGREISAKRFKALADAIVEARKVGPMAKPNPAFAFSRTQGAAQVQLRPGVNLKEIAKRPDSDVLQLPDGRKFTVGDLKKLSAIHQKRTGKSLMDVQASVQRPSREGVAIKVSSKEELKSMAAKPDSTVLETPGGKRITLGELRAVAKARGKTIGELK